MEVEVLIITIGLFNFFSSVISGVISRDDVVLGDITVKNVLFGEVTEESGPSFNAAHFDGILGLGWTDGNINGIKSFFFEVMDQGLLSDHSYSLYFPRDTSEEGRLILGGVDLSYAASPFKYYAIQKGNW